MSPVTFILGAGKNIGLATAAKFASQGYKVAIASRSAVAGTTPEGYLSIPLDLASPTDIKGAFDQVVKDLGEPSVVVYNAASLIFGPEGPFTVDIPSFATSLSINTVSSYAALQAAHSLLPSLKEKKETLTFLYTGNALNTTVMPALLTLGVGKAASSHFIEALAEANEDPSFRLYYVDERASNGKPPGPVDGEAHAKFFAELVERKDQGPVQATFVKGVGYKKF